MVILEWLRHCSLLFCGPLLLRRSFPKSELREIQSSIRDNEKKHGGQICFAVEPALSLKNLLCGKSPRQRALQVFSDLAIWDTELNNGILIYVLLSHRQVEIVADRGVMKHLLPSQLENICHVLESEFAQGNFGAGVRQAIAELGMLLGKYFPLSSSQKNEISDKPVVL